MSDPSGGPSQINGYHAHVYYSVRTRAMRSLTLTWTCLRSGPRA